MRVARLITNETCNQRCAFCNVRRPAESQAFAAGSAVRARLESATASGAARLVITGGEPLLRPDLEAVVAASKRRGVEAIELETNGLLLTATRLASLTAAGVGLVRVHLPGWGDAWRQATGDTAPFETLLTALDLLQASATPWEAALPVVRATLDTLPQVPERLVERGLTPKALVVSVPSSAPNPESLASVPDAARCLEALDHAARRQKQILRLAPGTSFPPCLLSNPVRLSHLYALTGGGAARAGFQRVPACDSCQVADRCQGLPDGLASRLEGLTPRPVVEDRLRRRLTVIGSVEEQMQRELVTCSSTRDPVRGLVPSTIVRVNFFCNQACHFCCVSTHLPTASDDQVRQAIIDASKEGGDVVFSGGEPTLNPQLAQWVRLAKREGAGFIELQTNATRLGDDAKVTELIEAGVDMAFVSLHGATADTSDAVTDTPGTFVQTVAGLDALHRSRMTLRVNFVFCVRNREEFPAFMEMVGTRWPRASVTISVAGAFADVVPRTKTLIPRFSDLRQPLKEGLEVARRLGMEVSGFESMCGIPMCQVPEDPAVLAQYPEAPEEEGGGEFVRAEACTDCDLRTRCWGVRTSYAEIYGTDELVPVRLPPAAQMSER